MHRCVRAEDVLYSSFCVSILQMASTKSPAGDDAGFPWQPVMVAGTERERVGFDPLPFHRAA